MNRLTFRDPVSGTAWQKQLRDRYQAEGTPPVPHLDVGKSIIRPISRRAAEQVILKYEWLGTMVSTSHHYGIFFGPYCAGVVCYAIGGGGANVNAHKEWGIARHELAYLARGANVHWSPPHANSRLVAISLKLLAKQHGVKLALAYSDTDAGEIGTIYQAANWTCVGRGSSTRQWVAPNGRVHDQKLPHNLANQKGGKRRDWTRRLKQAGWREQTTNPKWRYVYVLDKRDKNLLARVAAKATPYPKRPEVHSSQRALDR